MNEIEIGLLEACQAYVACQYEMLPQLAEVLGMDETHIFYHWAMRRCAQSGSLTNTDWNYFFHGMECDFDNRRDGRHLRMDFGPKGRVGILDCHGVLTFINSSVSPWPEFPILKAYFEKNKISKVWRRLESQGLFEAADSELVNLLAKHTAREPDGLLHVRFPAEITDEMQADCNVAHRQQLSATAMQILQTRNVNLLHHV
jgi:hypothetical protein